MRNLSASTNLKTYDAPGIALHYASLDSGYLAGRASRYVGVDYATEMVKACRGRFPGVEFMVADAADLSALPDGSFDAVVFAFNGIDYVLPAKSRHACFEHIHRVLSANGVVIFSSHNPRAVVVRPRWNRSRVRSLAREFSAGSVVLHALLLPALSAARIALAWGQSLWGTIQRLCRRIPSHMFWIGEGEAVDTAHGGLLTHYWLPERVVEELSVRGFQVERILGDEYPNASRRYATDWYYYVFTKR